MAIHEETGHGAERCVGDPIFASPTYLRYAASSLPVSALLSPSRVENYFQYRRSVSDIHSMSANCAHAHAHVNMPPPKALPPLSPGFHPYSTHPRTTPSSTHSRSNAQMSLSSSSSTPRPSAPPSSSTSVASFTSPQIKPKKLLNRDRKAICEYAVKNPDARQEDIATTYGIDRSTVSKILKMKDKWLSMIEGERSLVAKNR